MRREHVEHFISLLDDRDRAKKTDFAKVEYANEMEETLRAYQRMETDRFNHLQDLTNSDFRPTPYYPPTPAKPARAVRALRVEIQESGSEIDFSGSSREEEPRNVFVAATSECMKNLRD